MMLGASLDNCFEKGVYIVFGHHRVWAFRYLTKLGVATACATILGDKLQS